MHSFFLKRIPLCSPDMLNYCCLIGSRGYQLGILVGEEKWIYYQNIPVFFDNHDMLILLNLRIVKK